VGSAGLVVQCVPGGEPSAVAARRGGDYVVSVPGVATFAFGGPDHEVRVSARSAAAPDAVAGVFRSVIVPFALQVEGDEAFHASAVATTGGIVAFCGSSGAGKTTLAFGLSLRDGFMLWADDAVVVSPPGHRERSWTCRHLHQEPNLRPPSRAHFGAAEADAVLPGAAPALLRGLVFLGAADEVDVPMLADVPLVSAFTELLQHAYCFFVDAGRDEQTLRAVLDLVASIPTYRLTFPRGFDRLDGVLDLLARTFGDETSVA
jgi:hypothetical protein